MQIQIRGPEQKHRWTTDLAIFVSHSALSLDTQVEDDKLMALVPRSRALVWKLAMEIQWSSQTLKLWQHTKSNNIYLSFLDCWQSHHVLQYLWLICRQLCPMSLTWSPHILVSVSCRWWRGRGRRGCSSRDIQAQKPWEGCCACSSPWANAGESPGGLVRGEASGWPPQFAEIELLADHILSWGILPLGDVRSDSSKAGICSEPSPNHCNHLSNRKVLT